MLTIRFQRTGRKNVPSYRLVVTEKTAPPKGKVKEYLGYYLPSRDPHVFEFDKERIEHWIKSGAQVSDTAARMLMKSGIKGLEKFILPYTKQRNKKEAKMEKSAAKEGDKEKKKE